MGYPAHCTDCGGLVVYDSSIRAIACRSCGRIYDPLNTWDNQKIHDDMIYLAGEHVKAGNWDEALGLVTHLSTLKHPGDPRIYSYTLIAATKGFSDPDTLDYTKRKLASEAWDKLVRLKSITPEMVVYGQNHYAKRQAEKDYGISRILLWLFLAALSSIIAAIFFVTSQYYYTALFISGVIVSFVMALLKFINSISCHNDSWYANRNPFKY